MQFALNYSQAAVDLLTVGVLQIDLFKTPNWDDLIEAAAQYRPIHVHFPFKAGMGLPDSAALNQAARHIAESATPHINTHLYPRDAHFTNAHDPGEVAAAMIRDIQPMVARFGADAVVAENIPYPESAGRQAALYTAALPETIHRVIEATGVGLLLDIGHAARMAEHMALDPRRYIAQLPVQHLRELHITGLGYGPDGHRSDHLQMRDDDWALFGWVLDRVRIGEFGTPRVVACEYGGVGGPYTWRSDPVVIAHDVPRMVEMVRAAAPVTQR